LCTWCGHVELGPKQTAGAEQAACVSRRLGLGMVRSTTAGGAMMRSGHGWISHSPSQISATPLLSAPSASLVSPATVDLVRTTSLHTRYTRDLGEGAGMRDTAYRRLVKMASTTRRRTPAPPRAMGHLPCPTPRPSVGRCGGLLQFYRYPDGARRHNTCPYSPQTAHHLQNLGFNIQIDVHTTHIAHKQGGRL
jgi:hypothetical protein